MSEVEGLAIAVVYVVVAPLWGLLALWTRAHAGSWAFTPRWHRTAVPLVRALFVLTLPLEAMLAERTFIPSLFVLGTVATLFWLGWRFHYLSRAPRPLPRGDSVRYNMAYLANLLSFGLACHSFVCVVVALSVGMALLMVRERSSQGEAAGAC